MEQVYIPAAGQEEGLQVPQQIHIVMSILLQSLFPFSQGKIDIKHCSISSIGIGLPPSPNCAFCHQLMQVQGN